MWSKNGACKLDLRLGDRYLMSTKAQISEEGRQFILKRLQMLTDDPEYGDGRLRALFTLSRFHLADENLHGSSDHAIEEWVQAFKDKVSEIERHPVCPQLPH